MYRPDYFLLDEKEKLLTMTAAARPAESEAGPGVVILETQATLCTCRSADDAKLIAKLWNGAEV